MVRAVLADGKSRGPGVKQGEGQEVQPPCGAETQGKNFRARGAARSQWARGGWQESCMMAPRERREAAKRHKVLRLVERSELHPPMTFEEVSSLLGLSRTRAERIYREARQGLDRIIHPATSV